MNATVAEAIVEAREGARSEPRAATWALRRKLTWASVAADLLIALASYEVALVIFHWFHHSTLRLAAESFDWGMPVGMLAILLTFLVLGLYKIEAYVSRPLHLMIIAKGTLIALVIAAFFVFAVKSPMVSDSRLTIFATFLAFFLLDGLARLWLLDKVYQADVRARRGGTFVIGWGAGSSHLASRCSELRGFAPVTALQPKDRRLNGFDAEPAVLAAIAVADPAPRQVILDAPSLGHKACFDLIAAARERGAEVYIAGRSLSTLDSTRLLIRLFEMPMMRVQGAPEPAAPIRRSKRAFDMVTAVVALVLLAPAFALIAILIKRDSPGPVFYRQVRVGLRGRTFEFLKFRSMTVGNDSSRHREACQSFIVGGEAEDLMCLDEWGRPVYKIAEDERVTRVGHYLRKYSLDELPQFWNVLKGDMSMVGPRPALEYEVGAYHPWHHQRLEITPGVSGLWQVAGRSRVGFDDMVFQDVIYAYNQSLLTDVNLCLRTVPAMLIGRGAA